MTNVVEKAVKRRQQGFKEIRHLCYIDDAVQAEEPMTAQGDVKTSQCKGVFGHPIF